ncbi:MAG: pyrroline-5-carboxylate reductase [Methylocystis sp.]|nr:pyrroline-5-carboxylate reductase [Methylocystis sp.]MBI3275450.1 pyrroline-5-carboxylate reductase [Methylocystis sp.]
MGFALLQGWAARGLAGAGVTVLEPHPTKDVTALCTDRGFRLNPPVGQGPAPESLVLAIKPQMLESVAPSLVQRMAPGALVVSILAGKAVATIAARLPAATAIVRAMPNTPAAIGRGVTGAFANAAVSETQRRLAHALLASVGAVEWVESEELIDAVTAVSGCGPAYVFYFVEALAQAGAAVGLPADLAARLARATLIGSGELLHRSAGVSPETLRQNVTSPGGATAAALEVLMARQGLIELLARAAAAAKRRAGELSG